MIIECEKCNKKFEVQDNLIPDKGRLLQCGTCRYQWHFTPNVKLELTEEVETPEEIETPGEIETPEEIKPSKEKSKSVIKKIKPQKIHDLNEINNKHEAYNDVQKTKKSIGVLSFLLVVVISFVALIILVDTFKNQLSSVIPSIDLYIESLHELLKDIFLFFSDLLK